MPKRTSTVASGSTDALEESPNGDDIAIGMYHPRAGTRDAGGVSVFIREILSAMPSSSTAYLYTNNVHATRGDSPQVLTPDESVDLDDTLLPINHRALPTEVSDSISFFSASVRDGLLGHLEQHVDVLYTHNLVDTVLLSRVVDIPVVRLFHAFNRVGIGGKSMPYLADAAGYVANSRQAASQVSSELGLDIDGIVYPGVDVDRFSPDADPTFVRSDEISVLFVGRLVEEKGVYDLVDALSGLQDDVHLYLIGRGDVRSLRECAERAGVADSLSVVGTVPHEQLPGYYAACDVFCLPSYYETFGLVNIEAMACGAPVLTTDISAISEYVTHGETGYLIDPGDVTSLQSALEDLISSPELRDDIGRAARETSLQYSWKSSADRLTKISQTLVE